MISEYKSYLIGFIILLMFRRDQGAKEDTQRYRKRMNELYQERKDLVNNIKALNRKKKIINDGQSQKKITAQNTLQEFKPQPSSQQIRSIQNLGEHHPHLNTQEQQIKKVIDIQSSIKDRNKRLFGGLNVYLKKAQNKLREEEQKAKNKKTIQQQAIQKQKKLCLKLQEQKKKEMEVQMQKLKERKDKNSKELLQTENIILKNKFITYVSDLQSFLLTKSKPSIAWKPSCSNQQIDSLYKKQDRVFQDEVNRKEDQIMGYNQKFDFTQYIHANQKEYYNNILQGYFKQKTSFLVTKKTPPILWLPNSEGLAKMSSSFKQTKDQLTEEFSKRQAENDQFYQQFSKEEQREQLIDQAQSESGH